MGRIDDIDEMLAALESEQEASHDDGRDELLGRISYLEHQLDLAKSVLETLGGATMDTYSANSRINQQLGLLREENEKLRGELTATRQAQADAERERDAALGESKRLRAEAENELAEMGQRLEDAEFAIEFVEWIKVNDKTAYRMDLDMMLDEERRGVRRATQPTPTSRQTGYGLGSALGESIAASSRLGR